MHNSIITFNNNNDKLIMSAKLLFFSYKPFFALNSEIDNNNNDDTNVELKYLKKKYFVLPFENLCDEKQQGIPKIAFLQSKFNQKFSSFFFKYENTVFFNITSHNFHFTWFLVPLYLNTILYILSKNNSCINLFLLPQRELKKKNQQQCNNKKFLCDYTRINYILKNLLTNNYPLLIKPFFFFNYFNYSVNYFFFFLIILIKKCY